MKRIIFIALGIALAVYLVKTVEPAQAQAVNHEAIVATLQDMKGDINRMIQLVERHKAATVAVGDEQVTLTAGQLTQIITKYQALKTGLAAKYQQLP